MGQANSLLPQRNSKARMGTAAPPPPGNNACSTREQAEDDWVVLERCACGAVSDEGKNHDTVQPKAVESRIPSAKGSELPDINTPRSLVPLKYNLTTVVAMPERPEIIDCTKTFDSGHSKNMEELAFKAVRLSYSSARAMGPLLLPVVANVLGELEQGLGIGT